MEVKIVCARVYATDDQYGEAPREQPAGVPLTFTDFPRAGEEVTVDLGSVPTEIVEANRVRRAIGGVMIRNLVGEGGEPLTLQQRVDKVLAEGPPGTELEECNWYVTLALSRVIDVPDDQIADTDFAFLNEPFGLVDELVDYARPHLDAVAVMASTIIDPRAFGEIALDDRVLFFSEGKRPAGVPVMTAGAVGLVVTRGGESLAQLTQRIELLAGVDPAELANSGLGSVAHWRVQALLEKDPWKRFSWTFNGLEILVNKLSAGLRPEFLKSLRLAEGSEIVEPELPLDEIVWESSRMPLKAKFALVASALFPESATEDTETFGQLKRARDDVAHGTLRNEDDLPVSACETLFEKYLGGAIKHVILGVPASTAWEDAGKE
jgi:hypothetical protein